MAEHSTVNRRVAGSSPAWGVFSIIRARIGFKPFFNACFRSSIVGIFLLQIVLIFYYCLEYRLQFYIKVFIFICDQYVLTFLTKIIFRQFSLKNELIYPCLGLKTNYSKTELRQLLFVFKTKIYAEGKTNLTKFKTNIMAKYRH